MLLSGGRLLNSSILNMAETLFKYMLEYYLSMLSFVSISQVDIGQGWKPPGHYVQRSCGLFPAPYPQNSPEVEPVCKLFELLGIFIAKCIQDKRRVDLPLARSFFKLMTVTKQSMEGFLEQEDSEQDQSEGIQSNNPQVMEDVQNDSSQQEEMSNRQQQWQSRIPVQPNSGNQNVTDAGAATSSKEAELQMLVTREEDEITKDSGGEKEELVLEELGEGGLPETEPTWFEGILQLQDLEDVNQHR